MSDYCVNHALETTVTPLPGGLYLLKMIRDEWAILYPTAVLNAIDAAYDKRLMQEKAQHVDAMDEIDRQRQHIERLERELAEARLPKRSKGHAAR